MAEEGANGMVDDGEDENELGEGEDAADDDDDDDDDGKNEEDEENEGQGVRGQGGKAKRVFDPDNEMLTEAQALGKEWDIWSDDSINSMAAAELEEAAKLMADKLKKVFFPVKFCPQFYSCR